MTSDTSKTIKDVTGYDNNDSKVNIPVSDTKNVEIKQPSPNVSKTEKSVSPLTTLSSRADPYPHYLMSLASTYTICKIVLNLSLLKEIILSFLLLLLFSFVRIWICLSIFETT